MAKFQRFGWFQRLIKQIRIRFQHFHMAVVLDRLLKIIGWALIVSSAGTLLFNFIQGVPLRDSVLIPGLSVALAGQIFTQAKSLSDGRREESKFYLDSCIRAYDEAEGLLRDGNNQRIKWIAAERALKVAFNLASRVSVDSHKKVLELHEMKYRRIFYGFLKKQATFFYGVSNQSLDLDEAAKQSSQGEENEDMTTISSIRQIPESSLLTVWEAAQWPKDTEEKAIASHEYFPKGVLDRLSLLYPGLSAYIEHSRMFHSAVGKLYPRKAADYTTGRLPWDDQ